LWERVMEAGKPFGIAPTAPNLIRSIEGGLLSYVSDITLNDNPFVIGMDKFVNLDQPDDFVGKAALTKIKADGAKRKLVGFEMPGEPLVGSNEHFWSVLNGSGKIGHVSRCVFSPRLEKNIGWANVPIERSDVGTEIDIETEQGIRSAIVCEAPWFPPQIKIPPLDDKV